MWILDLNTRTDDSIPNKTILGVLLVRLSEEKYEVGNFGWSLDQSNKDLPYSFLCPYKTTWLWEYVCWFIEYINVLLSLFPSNHPTVTWLIQSPCLHNHSIPIFFSINLVWLLCSRHFQRMDIYFQTNLTLYKNLFFQILESLEDKHSYEELNLIKKINYSQHKRNILKVTNWNMSPYEKWMCPHFPVHRN